MAIEVWISGIAVVPTQLERDITQEMANIFGEDMRFTVKGRLNDFSKEMGPAGLIINNLQLPKTCPNDYGIG